MVDREKVLVVLRRRFPGSTPDQLAAAANAIVGLDEEWEELKTDPQEFGFDYSVQCTDICLLANLASNGVEFRIFRKREREPA